MSLPLLENTPLLKNIGVFSFLYMPIKNVDMKFRKSLCFIRCSLVSSVLLLSGCVQRENKLREEIKKNEAKIDSLELLQRQLDERNKDSI